MSTLTSPSMKRSLWLAPAALACVLAVAPVLPAQDVAAVRADDQMIDLNTASEAVLETLPGIDQYAARQIIAGRPYAAVADLSKTGLPANTIERIAPLVKVGPGGRAAVAVGKAADATAKGVEKGVDAATRGVQAGAAATASAAGTVDRALTGAPRVPPQAGMVWANPATKVYHKEGDPSYGTTKKGKWLTEEQAIKSRYRAAKPNAIKEK
jgi:hypothetical protein